MTISDPGPPAAPLDDTFTTGPDLAAAAELTSGSDTWHTTGDGRALPALTLADGPHGLRRQTTGGDALGIGDSVAATCFPPAVGLACTWNPDLVRHVGEALGRQARALGVDVLLGPGMNIKRSPLGGRNFEYFSEDPYVTGTLAAAFVDGVQSTGVGACVKHFAVNNQETDRMRVSALVDDQALREVYLAGFEHVVRTARPWAVMSAYNALNGVPASENRWLLTDVLRDEWGFDGVVVSDWGAVRDRVAAVRAGCDVEMPPTGTDHLVLDAVRSGDLEPDALHAVGERLRLLARRVRAGGHDDRPAHTPDQLPTDLAAHGADLARRAAREAAVLLKNDGGLLPLDPATARIAVIGELARTPRYQGGGSSRVVPTEVSAPLDALTGRLGPAVRYSPGYTLDGLADETLIAAAVDAARDADVTLLFLGLPPEAESEGFDRATIALPADQLRLLRETTAATSHTVVVLSHGGVVGVADWHHLVPAILDASLLGQACGEALTDLLLGDAAPSGRLAETVPLRLEDHPSHLTFPGRNGQALYGESRYVGYRHFDTLRLPVAYPFGHGLTYTTFDYRDLTVAEHRPHQWQVSFTLANTGSRAGSEVAQLYVGRDEPTPTRPRNVLRAYAKTELAAGESRRITFTVTARDLAVWDTRHQRWSVEPGAHSVRVGASVADIRLAGSITTDGDRYLPPLTATSTVGEWRAHPVGGPLLGGLMAGARVGRAARLAPELLRMVDATPLIVLRTYDLGLTDQVIDLLVATAAEQRADLVRTGPYRDR
ncbi:glycoside hydrolase family 3 C-terminal domain-containing protein [Micromonospora sp. NPDC047812]|uniref:glycoside hydrolase family 3 C-terminal domain-containing protein n=1 Tax=Micromonospora sp. NPDC047812 TaxID=3155742 RepID=UPI0034548004